MVAWPSAQVSLFCLPRTSCCSLLASNLKNQAFSLRAKVRVADGEASLSFLLIPRQGRCLSVSRRLPAPQPSRNHRTRARKGSSLAFLRPHFHTSSPSLFPGGRAVKTIWSSVLLFGLRGGWGEHLALRTQSSVCSMTALCSLHLQTVCSGQGGPGGSPRWGF